MCGTFSSSILKVPFPRRKFLKLHASGDFDAVKCNEFITHSSMVRENQIHHIAG